MLIQSHNGIIRLLPAIPGEWKDGEVKGLCARGGFKVDMKWKNSKLAEAKVSSEKGGKCLIMYNGNNQTIELKAGESKVLSIIK
jgi:alpha-L-fucosidase 2